MENEVTKPQEQEYEPTKEQDQSHSYGQEAIDSYAVIQDRPHGTIPVITPLRWRMTRSVGLGEGGFRFSEHKARVGRA